MFRNSTTCKGEARAKETKEKLDAAINESKEVRLLGWFLINKKKKQKEKNNVISTTEGSING